MGVLEAASWGLAGGAVAGLLSLSAAVAAAGFRWPWPRRADGGMWPYLFVATINLVVGTLVAGASHSEIVGAWPAFIMGVSAPSVVRGILSRVEVTERKPETDVGDDGQS